MQFSVIIPSRYGSTRLPAKALADIGGHPLIEHVVMQALKSKARKVLVATDDERIQAALESSRCEAVITSAHHQSGSDRLAEVVTRLELGDDEIVVNVQGDEPMIPPELIDSVAQCLQENPNAQMSTAAQNLELAEDINNPNFVKVVLNRNNEALYFSRSAIPFARDPNSKTAALHHIGIYAYRVGFLKKFAASKPGVLETCESLEQLRALENGAKIAVYVTNTDAGIGVDTPADLDRVRELMAAQT